ncbi:hypothetical protein MMC10_004822 [Thelotrema lepadinum]|nr:hypothetical protein [Thelotrema lepadinum]
MNQDETTSRSHIEEVGPEWKITDHQRIYDKENGVEIGFSRVDSCPSSRASSFSSVKEDDQGVSQSFVSSKSRDRLSESQSAERLKQLLALSTLRRDDGFVDLVSLEEDALSLGGLSRKSSQVDLVTSAEISASHVSRSSLGHLPVEVLEQIIEMLVLDVPPQDFAPRNVDLMSCLLTSKKMNAVTTNILYRQITLPHSYIFSKFLKHLSTYPDLGRLMRRLDLSHFTSVGLGRSREKNSQIRNLTSDTLLNCMDLAPNLKELLLQEHLEQDINDDVLRKAFYGLPQLKSLDLCGCYAGSFAEAFTSALAPLSFKPTFELEIENFSLHECFTIKTTDFELLLPRLPRLKILDLYHTRVTDKALHSIRDTTKLTHLNIGHCSNLTGSEVASFLAEHSAAKNLVYLNISCDTARHRLFEYHDLDRLLPTLPTALRSLNLGGAQIDPATHMADLHRLSKHLEELGLSSTNLSMADVKSFFLPQQLPSHDSPSPSSNLFFPIIPPSAATPTHQPQPSEAPCALRFLDLTSNPTITQPSLFFDNSTSPTSSRIDAPSPFSTTTSTAHQPTPFLLTPSTSPLEVLELSAPVLSSLKSTHATNKRYGWLVKELGRRGWYVREKGSADVGEGNGNGSGLGGMEGGRRDGARWWKMGARSWGMRKVPVVTADVGGFYGFCMFRK